MLWPFKLHHQFRCDNVSNIQFIIRNTFLIWNKKKWTKNEIQLNVNQKGTIEKEITNKLNAQKTKCPEHSELKIKGKKIKIKIINERRWCRVAFYMKHDSYRNLYTRLKWEYFLGFCCFEFLFVAFFCLYCAADSEKFSLTITITNTNVL